VIDPSIGAGENGRFRADLAAGIALNAAVGEKGDLLPCLMGFRIVAPGASEGTALEEENRSDSRPVMKAETLDIKDQGLFLAGFLGLLGQSVAHGRSSCVLGRENIQRTGSVGPANRLLRKQKQSAPQRITSDSSEVSMPFKLDSVNKRHLNQSGK
jgi:hypothetical protein